jgi:hypothetical protein
MDGAELGFTGTGREMMAEELALSIHPPFPKFPIELATKICHRKIQSIAQ